MAQFRPLSVAINHIMCVSLSANNFIIYDQRLD
jgi:hypothetical protein